MPTQIYSIPLSFNEVLNLVRSLSMEHKLKMEKEIEKETLIFRSKMLDDKVKTNQISIDDIMTEISAYRKSNCFSHRR